MTTPGSDPPSREMKRRRTIISSAAKDIRAIRDKGETAQTREADRVVFRGMSQELSPLFEKFSNAWDQLVELSEGTTTEFPSDQEKVFLEQIKIAYYEAKGFALHLEDGARRQETTTLPFNSTIAAPSCSRTLLPTIKIPTFNGDFAEWPTFSQLFKSIIISDQSLTDTERFQYLVSYLTGPALNCIRHITVDGNNFQLAWTSLSTYFDDKRKLANVYLDKILEFKSAVSTPSAESLQFFLSKVCESISTLLKLEIPSLGEYILCELALRGLDHKTREAFEMSSIGTYPTSATLRQFVQNRYSVLRLTSRDIPVRESSQARQNKMPRGPNTFAPNSSRSHALMAHAAKDFGKKPGNNPGDSYKASNVETPPRTCYICANLHSITECPKFKSSTPAGRLELLRKFPGCRLCFHAAHKTRDCSARFRCKECGSRHNTFLHLPVPSEPVKQGGPSALPSSHADCAPGPSSFAGTHICPKPTAVLLGTVLACATDSRGNSHTLRGVLDPGSQFSFLAESCVKMLGLQCKFFDGRITGVNQSALSHTRGIVKLKLSPVSTSSAIGSKSYETEAVVVPTITPPLPQAQVNFDWTDYFTFPLSDPSFFRSGPIHFLIGADLYPEIVTGAPITVCASGPKLVDTVFGFSVVGKVGNPEFSSTGVGLMCLANPSFALERFWELEEPIAQSQPSSHTAVDPQELACEEHFQRTHYRNPEGRYGVSLPFLKYPPKILPNVSRVISRFHALERKLSSDENLRRDYVDFMSQYLELGHMEIANNPPSYLIPHHGVYKYDSDGVGKLRVVFDASFRTHTGSLNDHLHTGPKLQLDIGSVMLNFRIPKFVLSCDIVKMFRQILVEPKDRTYQQIVWRSCPTEPLKFYNLNTVTYGVRSSPFQAQRVLHQLARDDGDDFPMAAEAILSSTYVDDIVSGADTIASLFELSKQLVALLGKGGFELGKWKSNCPSLLGSESSAQSPLQFSDCDIASILGMQWCPVSDSIYYKVDTLTAGFTKRSILSTIAQLYDPLGYLAPVVFQAKRVLQETWKAMLGWDDSVPDAIYFVWEKFLTELPLLSNIRILRPLPASALPPELICFSDASERGYCGAVYLRTSNSSGKSTLTLIKAKTRLAPLKSQTIPRLELCGALLLALIVKSLNQFIAKVGVSKIFCFTDSTVVLSWLHTPVYRLQTFVANRVQQVLEFTELQYWYHVKGVDNPADIGSRGVFPSILEHHHLWWQGPAWCTLPLDQWPVSAEEVSADVPELKKPLLSMLSQAVDDSVIKLTERCSSYLRLVRVIAYVFRFARNCRGSNGFRNIDPLDPSEIDNARKSLVRGLQAYYFPLVSTSTFDDLPLELRRLSVFIDAEQLIRVGGRLSKSDLPYDHKFPLLLPNKSHFTSLIILHFHKIYHHVGPSTLLSCLRRQYWIPKGKSRVKSVIQNCVICTRYARTARHPFMGDLPRSRFGSERAFVNTGVDFAGPFFCKPTIGRSRTTYKVYLCLFICLSSRALHLELVTSLNVESFLNSFDRFMSLYGVPANMYSDCGTNFVGAARYLQEVSDMMSKKDVQESIINHSSDSGVRWHFNPPRAPHFGGSWEAGVRSVKTLLRKSFGDSSYTEEELSTIFAKVAGILNSRPLYPISDSVNDLEPLTPGHLLIGQPLTALPEPDFQDVASNRLSRWQLVRQRVQNFWSRWKDEYLSTLQARQKWCKQVPNLRVNDLVLMSDQQSPPQQWPMARVIELHPGADQIVRVVTVRTAKGSYKRPVTGLIPLPVSTD